MVGRGRGAPSVAPTSLVCLGTPLWWFRASSGAAAAAEGPGRRRGVVRRPPRHRRDAGSTAWPRGSLAARLGSTAEHPTHWLISTQRSSLARTILAEKDSKVEILRRRVAELESELASGGHEHRKFVEIACSGAESCAEAAPAARSRHRRTPVSPATLAVTSTPSTRRPFDLTRRFARRPSDRREGRALWPARRRSRNSPRRA